MTSSIDLRESEVPEAGPEPAGQPVGFGPGQRLTPDGVRRWEFSRTPLGRRGYHEADVEQFRTRVVQEIGRSNAEKAALRQELQRAREEVRRLRDYYRRNQVDVDGRRAETQPAPVDIASVQAVNVMSQAQQAADQHIAQAEDYARRLVANARLQYEDILVSAHEQAQEAAAEAGRLYDAEVARGEEPDGAPSGSTDPVEMQHLQSRLAYMRTFAQVTQVQLHSILDALREELDQLTELPRPDGATTVHALAGPPLGGPATPPAGLTRA